MYKLLASLLLIVALGCVIPCQAYSSDRPADVEWCKLESGYASLYLPSEGSDPAPTLIQLYDSANKTIDIAIYAIDNQKIMDALTRAYDRGINVRIITDSKMATRKYQTIVLNTLKVYGIPILINSHVGEMHLKVSIVDKSFVAIGSFDYTLDSSQTSDDMVIVLTEPCVISKCQDYFDRMWDNTKAFEKY